MIGSVPRWVDRFRGLARPADVALVLVFVGCLLRFLRWWPGRPLWLDEQFVAVNLREGYGAVVGELLFNQAAPLGWLWTNRLFMDLFGTGERALHLLSFLFGLGTVVFGWLIGRRWLGVAGTLVLVGLVSIAPDLLRYSVELKQYESDAFWVLALIGLAGWAVERETGKSAVAWWLTAAVASWYSMAAIMVTPFLGLVLFVSTVRHRGWRAAIRPHLAALVWVVAFAAHYALSLRFTLGDDALDSYWRGFGYPPEDKGFDDVVSWILQRPGVLTGDPVRFPVALTLPLWTLAAVGVVTAFVYRRALGTILAVPFVAGFGLAVLALVPLTGRLSLWLVIPLFVAVAVTVRLAGTVLVRWWREDRKDLVAGVGVAVVLVATSFVALLWEVAWQSSRPPPYLDQVDDRSAIRYIAQRHRPGDVVIVSAASGVAYQWYADPARVRPAAAYSIDPADPECDPAALAALVTGADRVYLYQGHRIPGGAGHQQILEQRLVDLGATKVESRRYGDAAGVAGIGLVIEYDMGGEPRPDAEPGTCIKVVQLSP